MLRKVIWTCMMVGLLLIVAVVAFAIDNWSQAGPTSTPESENGSFIYSGIELGLTEEADDDGDWVSDRLEFWEYGTNPLKIDTDDGGVDDFNEIFTYPHLLNPLDPTDDQEFLAMLPNVESAPWHWSAGGTSGNFLTKYVKTAKRDPLVQWYAERTTIKWQDVDHVRGSLTVNGEPLFLKYGRSGSCSPSYYLTHGRKGNCLETSAAHYTILELMGYECLHITGRVKSGAGHGWVEADIDGKIYVVDFNLVEISDIFYQTHDWTIEYKKDL